MHLASDTWRLCWAALCSVILACGGETSDGTQSQTPTPSGGSSSTGSSPSTGGGSATGGAAATGGFDGCANRSVVYGDGTTFPFANQGISYMPECIPTCGQNLESIQALPAGPCTRDPTCVTMILPDSGIWHYYLCTCASQQWSCVSVSGAP